MPVSEELNARIETLRSQYEDLQDTVAMTDVTATLGDIATKIEGLPGKIAELRDRGYVYASYLEHKAATLGSQWSGIHEQINLTIREELGKAQLEFEMLDALWDGLEAALAKEEGAEAPVKKRSGNPLSLAVLATLDEPEGGASDLVNKLGAMGGKKPSSGAGALAGAMGGGTAKAEPKSLTSLADKMAGTKTNKASSKALAGLAKKMDGLTVGPNIEELIEGLEDSMGDVEEAVSTAKERINGLYGEVPSNVSQTMSQISEINTYLERRDEATFDFLAGEDMFMAVKAEWKKGKNKKENPDGFFYITNQRIIMEQQEKKGGFMGMGGKREEGALWEAPIESIESVESEKKGMLGGIDLIHIRFGSGAPFGETTIEVKGGLNAEWFASKLKRASKLEIETERGVDHDPAEIEAIANAPTMCAVCGANFDQRLVAGMTQMECDYCGSVVRLG